MRGTGARHGSITMTTSPMLPTALRKVLFHHAKSRSPDLCCDTEKTSNQSTGSGSALPRKRRSTALTTSRKRYFHAWLRKTRAVATKLAPSPPSDMSCSHSDSCDASVRGFTNRSMTSNVVSVSSACFPPHISMKAEK